MLTPSDYGLVGMLTIFIAISQSLVDSGFSQALIRKQNRTELDNSTVFFFNIVVGVILYVILFFASPLIAKFYNEPLLTPLTRFISLSVIINSFIVVQRALLTAKVDFKSQAKASFAGAIISGITGIWLAYKGHGVWSIAWYQLSNLMVNCILLWYLANWRPKLIFDWKIFKEMFSFGSKLAMTGIINTIYNNILIVIIGKIFRASDLGYYTRAHQFADFPSATGTSIIQKVTYPILCSIQDDDNRLKYIYRKFLGLSTYIIFPLMLGLAALSKPFISVFLNDNWAYTATLLPIICFSMMLYPVHAINLNFLQVKGKSELILKLEIIKKIVGLILIAITVWFGIVALCYGMVLNSIIALFINTHYTGKFLHLGFFTQMKDILPSFLYAISMFVIVYLSTLLFNNDIMQLFVGFLTGVIYYIIIGKFSSSKNYNEIIALIRNR